MVKWGRDYINSRAVPKVKEAQMTGCKGELVRYLRFRDPAGRRCQARLIVVYVHVYLYVRYICIFRPVFPNEWHP